MDVEKYRKSPRPTLYNSSAKLETEISFEFETWLIRLPNSQKQLLISRLRNSLEKNKILLPKDDLEKKAYKQQARNAGGALTELDVGLGEFSAFRTSEIEQNPQIPEISLMLQDASRGFGEVAFRREEENYNLVYASFFNNQAEASTTSEPIRKQIQSWIGLISAYIT